MLTLPVNVTAPISTNLKPHASSTDIGAGHSPVVVSSAVRAVPAPQPEADTPPNALLATVNAVAATAGGRTVLQSLAFSVATLINVTRQPDEPLTALFLRIAQAIEDLPAADRQKIEVQAGLRALKIGLMELPSALRKPDGAQAARLTATAEAPLAKPGQTSVNAASTAYLQQGTNSGHTEETLAMRAAARNVTAGQSLFSPESIKPNAEIRPVDAKQLQSQLKTLFEPNAGPARRPAADAVAPDRTAPSVQSNFAKVEPKVEVPVRPTVTKPADALPLPPAKPTNADATVARADPQLRPETKLASADAILARADAVATKLAQLGIASQPMGAKLRELAREVIRDEQSIDNHSQEKQAEDARADGKREASPRRVETLLTLKGIAEAVTTLPARAAELLAGAALPERADSAMLTPDAEAEADYALPGWPSEVHETEPEKIAAALMRGDADEVLISDEEVPEAGPPAKAEERVLQDKTEASQQPAARPDGQIASSTVGLPFIAVATTPARESFRAEVREDETEQDNRDEQGSDEDESADRETRRPRDDYDMIEDGIIEDEPTIAITRDSSEADRAFAMYQRMSGV